MTKNKDSHSDVNQKKPLTCNQKYNSIGRHEWPPFLSEERRDKQPRDTPDLDRHGVSSGQSQAEESPDDFPEAWGETQGLYDRLVQDWVNYKPIIKTGIWRHFKDPRLWWNKRTVLVQ